MQMTPKLSGIGTTALTWCSASPLCHRDIDTIIRLKRTYDAVLVVLTPFAGGRIAVADQVKLFREAFAGDPDVIGVPLVGPFDTVAARQKSVLATASQYFDRSPEQLYVTPGVWPDGTDLDAAADALLAATRTVFPDSQCTLDRSVIMYRDSARRELEQQPLAHWDYIAPAFRRRYKLNVALVGGASTGKSTLARDLARYYAAPCSTEFARDYQPARNVMDSELDARDYREILEGQYNHNRALIEQPYGPGLFISDTETVTSATYIKLFLSEHFDELNYVVQDLVSRSHWDLILVLPPVAHFVDDGYRGALMGEGAIRQQYFDTIMALLPQYYDPSQIIVLDAKPSNDVHDPEGYYARFNQAVRLIDAAQAQGE